MGLHVFCAAIALMANKKIGVFDDFDGGDVGSVLLAITSVFLTFFPVIVIPVFWIIYITTITRVFDSITILFITLFGILLISAPIFLIIKIYWRNNDNIYLGYIEIILITLIFYAPNILQTVLIVLYWPISFYFVKTCVFILVLSLTRNVSYFTDKVPEDFLATSTTVTQWFIQELLNLIRK